MGADTPHLDALLTPEQVYQLRKGQPLQKGKSRLEAKEGAKPLLVVTDAAFKKTVRERDQMRCRKCGRKVDVLVSRVAKRAEVHHVYGRRGDFRHDDRFALLACCECHEQFTGRVNEKWKLVPVPTSKFITIAGRELLDCRGPVGFERVA